ncbi:helix-turn-helix transcriptional regulator [Aliiroseovarius sp. YM-037]|uniref:helix-turn-helix transcriptional regulator n=1 Tax=Aliiroseovarius sp. YM-037 TaxID=3341728 RepID=UPI003A811F73
MVRSQSTSVRDRRQPGPSAYVNRIRMEYAAMHFGSSDTPVADIAADCGIENPSHFYKLFREHYGNTPRQYRVLHRVTPVQP